MQNPIEQEAREYEEAAYATGYSAAQGSAAYVLEYARHARHARQQDASNYARGLRGRLRRLRRGVWRDRADRRRDQRVLVEFVGESPMSKSKQHDRKPQRRQNARRQADQSGRPRSCAPPAASSDAARAIERQQDAAERAERAVRVPRAAWPICASTTRAARRSPP